MRARLGALLLVVLMIVMACGEEPPATETAKMTAADKGRAAPEPPAAEEPLSEIRIKEFPFAVQCWTFRQFSFFETLAKVKDLGVQQLEAYPGQVLGSEYPGAFFRHDMPVELMDKVKTRLEQAGIALVGYGVVGFGNTEEEMAPVFEFAKKMGIRVIMTEPEYDDFSLLEQMVKKYNIKIAIHNHPDPTKYARPETVLERIKDVDWRIGVCADTGHWMRTGINPVAALKMLQGRIWNVHLKDLDKFGDKEARDVPFGAGKAEVKNILAELTRQNYSGSLSIEHENPDEVANPSPSIKKGLEYVASITYYKGYTELLSSWNGRFNKHGWNHYGPGYFMLDESSGILKSHGGMGLLWYSVKKFKDFELLLDFKCAQEKTNSGVFLRIPFIPVNNDYIYHSFEIQIDDFSKGVHSSGAVYDAEAPMSNASRPTGEWNHFKISFQGDVIKVELNGEPVISWPAEPRGKIKDFAGEGYFGLQNHDSLSPVYFRNLFIKEL